MSKVLQFEGDIRMWLLDPNTGTKTPVLADTDDAFGNTPIEANAAIFSYAAGDERTVKSKRRERFNQTIYSDQDPGESSLSLTLLELPGAILARIFYGEAADTDVTGSTVSSESVTITALDTWYPLAHRYLADSPTPVVKDATDTTTYVKGIDYEIDLRRGRIRALTGGDISASDVVHVGYTYLSYSLTTIRGGVKPQEIFYITGDMLNRPDKQDMELEIYEAKLSNDGDVDLFSADPITCTLKGPLITPDDKNEPYVARAYTKEAD